MQKCYGFVYFLLEEWSKAADIQTRLVHFYDVRGDKEKKHIAQIRAECAHYLGAMTTEQPSQDPVPEASPRVWYWWWIYQMLQQPEKAVDLWPKANSFAPDMSWDFALYKMLLLLSSRSGLEPIRVKILSVIRERFPQRL